MKCFACGKPLVAPAEECPHQPNDGIICSSHGNYGSTVFDSIDGSEELVFWICDACIITHKDRVVVYQDDNANLFTTGTEYFSEPDVDTTGKP